jgi:signal transduction histidine kinase
MSLRLRIVLTLLAIAAILIVPAALAISALSELTSIARGLKTRDAEASVAVGRLQTALQQVQAAARYNVALYVGLRPDQQSDVRTQFRQAIASVDSQFAKLVEVGYRDAATPALARWRSLKGALVQQQALVVERGDTAAAGELGRSTVEPGLAAMDSSLTGISRQIGSYSTGRVRKAEETADQGRTGTLLALAAALLVSLTIGAMLTRSLLRPIHELQRGMAQVSQGDLEPRVHIPRDRADELGDLARSFERMTRQLKELDRLKAEFVSVASHEIKTPLSVIRGYVSLLMDGIYGELTDEQKKTLRAVSDQTDRLTRLVHRLLDVSRFEAGGGRLELRDVEPVPFLEELTAGFRVLAMQNDIEFEVRLDHDLPRTIVADPERLNEVLGNLLSNAFKFTAKGGRITLCASRQGDGMVVEVEDTGVGIPADKLPKIFEKFFQVENDAQPRSVGSGLGLAIAREIMEAHGGTITAESQVGRGTRFRVFLPARPPQERAHYQPEATQTR